MADYTAKKIQQMINSRGCLIEVAMTVGQLVIAERGFDGSVRSDVYFYEGMVSARCEGLFRFSFPQAYLSMDRAAVIQAESPAKTTRLAAAADAASREAAAREQQERATFAKLQAKYGGDNAK